MKTGNLLNFLLGGFWRLLTGVNAMDFSLPLKNSMIGSQK